MINCKLISKPYLRSKIHKSHRTSGAPPCWSLVMEYSPLTEICYVIDNWWFRKEICHDTFFISGSLKIVLYILYILSSNYLVKPYTSTQLLDLCLLEACSSNTRSKGLRSETASCSAYIYTVFSTWCKSFSDTSPWTFLVPRIDCRCLDPTI